MRLSFDIVGVRHLEFLRQLRNQNRQWFMDTKEVDSIAQFEWFTSSINSGDLNLIIKDYNTFDQVGFISVYGRMGECATIGRMMIDDRFKHKGYMERAMIEVFDMCRKYFSISELILEVKKENIPARQLYVKLGFVTYGITKDTLIMRKKI